MNIKEQILRASEVQERLNISHSTLWRWRQKCIFPEPFHIPGTSIRGWRESTVNRWIEENFETNCDDGEK